MRKTRLPLGGAMLFQILLFAVISAAVPAPADSQTGLAGPKKTSAPQQRTKTPAVAAVTQDLIPTLVKPAASCEKSCAESKAFDPSFRRNPPVAKHVSLQVINREAKTRNARLVVDFAQDRRLKESLSILVGDTPTVLKRVSGTSYAGVINFDFAAFEAELKSHEGLVREEKTVPVFENRLLKGREKLKPANFDRERVLTKLDSNLIRQLLSNPANIDPTRELMITDLGVVEAAL